MTLYKCRFKSHELEEKHITQWHSETQESHMIQWFPQWVAIWVTIHLPLKCQLSTISQPPKKNINPPLTWWSTARRCHMPSHRPSKKDGPPNSRGWHRGWLEQWDLRGGWQMVRNVLFWYPPRPPLLHVLLLCRFRKWAVCLIFIASSAFLFAQNHTEIVGSVFLGRKIEAFVSPSFLAKQLISGWNAWKTQ